MGLEMYRVEIGTFTLLNFFIMFRPSVRWVVRLDRRCVCLLVICVILEGKGRCMVRQIQKGKNTDNSVFTAGKPDFTAKEILI